MVVPEDTLLYVVARDITSEREAALGLAEANARLREQINERERIEAALQQMQRLEAVGQLTAGVAHDFNNLLTVILTGASFLERDLAKRPGQGPHAPHPHPRSGERGAKLTSQLLAFSRRQRLEPVALNLNQTLTGLEELLRRTLGGNVSVRLDLDQALWQALTDPTQTEMIILNLAINARDAMPDGGQLTLTTRNTRIDTRPQRPEDPDPGEYVMLSIRDTGCGMNEEVLTKVFEPFFTTKDIGKGSGLGLAQVFGFAKQSGGGVHIDTAPGQGTQVAVYLPAVKDQAVSEPWYRCSTSQSAKVAATARCCWWTMTIWCVTCLAMCCASMATRCVRRTAASRHWRCWTMKSICCLPISQCPNSTAHNWRWLRAKGTPSCRWCS